MDPLNLIDRTWVEGRGPSDWMKGFVNEAVIVGVAVVVLGGWLLWITLQPGHREPNPR